MFKILKYCLYAFVAYFTVVLLMLNLNTAAHWFIDEWRLVLGIGILIVSITVVAFTEPYNGRYYL